MGIYQRGKIFWINYSGPGGQHFESSHSSRKCDAKELLEVRKGQVREGRLRLLRKSPQFEEFAEEFLKSVTHANTRRRYVSSFRNLKVHLRGYRLSEISGETLEDFKQERLKKGIRGATINRDLQLVRRIANVAIRKRLIATNPVSEIDFLDERKERRQPHSLSFSEQERLLSVASPQIRVLTVLITETGLRINREALQLLWDSVDLVNDALQIHDTKTAAGRRNIPLSEFCKEELKAWQALTGKLTSRWVFPNLTNPLEHLKDARRSWARALKDANIPYFPICNLRAAFASRLSAAGGGRPLYCTADGARDHKYSVNLR